MSKYHDILGVATDADKATVKKAYRTLASKHHPDKDGGSEAKFKEIQEAYDRVSHPDKYQEDMFGGNRAQGYRAGDGDFWENVNVNVNIRDDDNIDFGFKFADHLRRQKHHQQTVRLQFELTLESTLHDQTRQIHVPEYNIPPMEITIPAGIRNGENIQYTNLPYSGNNHQQRVLIVQFVYRKHPDFHVNPLPNTEDLTAHRLVSALDVMVGSTLKVKCLDGTVLAVKVPAGSENGTKLKIPAKGLKYKGTPNKFGDLFVIVVVTVPQLSDEEKEIITKLRDKRNEQR